jgi:hypothetical protein
MALRSHAKLLSFSQVVPHKRFTHAVVGRRRPIIKAPKSRPNERRTSFMLHPG